MDQVSTSPDFSNGLTASPKEEQHIRLACQACQRKKIKCDRHYPCGQCQRSSLQCVPSQRKPRTRHVGKRAVDSELRTRISKLESLVESLSGEVTSQGGVPADGVPERKGSTDDSSSAIGKYVASPFWNSLTTEVAALRDALEDEHLDDDQEANGHDLHTNSSNPSNQSPPEDANPLDYDLIVCPPGRLFVVPGALMEPSPEVSNYLTNAFIENVDPMFKVFHAPTLRTFMYQRTTYLGKDYDAPCNIALKRAVWFAAVNSLQDHITQSKFGQSRIDMLNHYRRLVGVSLAQADMINTTEIATLQALVTYLASSKITDTTRRVWTMTALVVRIARAMGLHHEGPGLSPFMTEIKRRLWHQVRVLDAFVGVDRGTEPMVQTASYDTPLPTHCNDSDFGPSSTIPPKPRERQITDMTFPVMVHGGTSAVMELMTPENLPSGATWEKRLQLAEEFGRTTRETYLQYCDPQNAFHRFLLAVGNSMCSSMILRAVRPMQRHLSSVPPRTDSPYVLQKATDNLRLSEHVYEDPEAEQWRWMIWVQWHGLAVALAGLCSIRGTELAETAWRYIDKAYVRSADNVADGRDGMLWKPIEKLYRKASAFRDAGPAPVQPQPIQTEAHKQPEPLNNGQNGTLMDFDFGPPTYALPPRSYPQMPRGPPASATASTAFNGFGGPYDVGSGFDSLSPLPADSSWLDWENVMNDFTSSNSELGGFGDMNFTHWADVNGGANPY